MSRILYSQLAFFLLASGCRPALTPTDAAPGSAWSAAVRKHNRDLGSQAEHSTPVDWQIGQSKEPVTFWLDVANSPKYGIDTRRVCILELFRRHVSAGMSLGELGEMLGKPKWLPNKWIYHLAAFAGGVPVDVVAGDTIFSIVPLPAEKPKENCSCICLRLPSGISRDELAAALRGERVPDRVAHTTIKQIGFIEYN